MQFQEWANTRHYHHDLTEVFWCGFTGGDESGPIPGFSYTDPDGIPFCYIEDDADGNMGGARWYVVAGRSSINTDDLNAAEWWLWEAFAKHELGD